MGKVIVPGTDYWSDLPCKPQQIPALWEVLGFYRRLSSAFSPWKQYWNGFVLGRLEQNY